MVAVARIVRPTGPAGPRGHFFSKMMTSTLQSFEPLAFQDLDFKSRALASIVEDSRLHKKTNWKLSEVAEQLVGAVTLARENCAEAMRTYQLKTASDASLAVLIQITPVFLATLRRLEDACRNLIGLIDSLQGIDVQELGVDVKVTNVRKCVSELAEMIQVCESFLDNLEWTESERTAIPSSRLDEIAEYCRSTGQASV